MFDLRYMLVGGLPFCRTHGKMVEEAERQRKQNA